MYCIIVYYVSPVVQYINTTLTAYVHSRHFTLPLPPISHINILKSALPKHIQQWPSGPHPDRKAIEPLRIEDPSSRVG